MKLEVVKLVADGLYKEAVCLYSQLHSSRLRPNKFTFPALLKACGKIGAVSEGQMLHTHLIKTGFQVDVYTSTSLSDMYVKIRLLDSALKVFDEIPEPNMTSLNVTISGFSQNGYVKEAFRGLRLVGLRGLRPDSFTIASVLCACQDVKHGVQVHCWAVKLGVKEDIYVATSLMTMYLNCTDLVSAAKAFESTQDKNVVCYNAFISGLLHNGVPRAVLDVFKSMRGYQGEEPNSVTLSCVFVACSDIKYLRFGRQVHGYIIKIEMSFDTMVGTAVIDMYCKCGCCQEAYDVFKALDGSMNLITWNSMIAGMMLNGQSENAVELFLQLESEGLQPDSATWNSMISGFSQLGKEGEAFMFFRKMQLVGLSPTLKSITSLLPASSNSSGLRHGKEIHAHGIKIDVNNDIFIATGLIDMYMKCGKSSCARRIFDQFDIKPADPAIWNAMILGYGRNGENESAFDVFDQMLEEKIQPNLVTFSCVLSVCSHTGEVDKGCQVFRMMTVDYELNPTPELLCRMVDLLGRSGRLDEARKLLQEVPEPNASILASLLGACKLHSNTELGEEMTKKLSELEPENPTPFVILSSIYASQGRWKDVEGLREMIDALGLRKLRGFSLIGVT